MENAYCMQNSCKERLDSGATVNMLFRTAAFQIDVSKFKYHLLSQFQLPDEVTP